MGLSNKEIESRRAAVASALRKDPTLTDTQLSLLLNIPNSSIRRHAMWVVKNCPDIKRVKPVATKKASAEDDLTIRKLQGETREWRRKYNESLDIISDKERQLEVLTALGDTPTVDPIITEDQQMREVVPVIVASDWHIEEKVSAAVTNGMNEYNPEIAEKSAMQFFVNAAVLVEQTKKFSRVNTIILAILGDIINGVLREEDLQNNAATPVDAVVTARTLIYKGIKYLADTTGCRIKVICTVGNHGRLTDKIFPSNQVHNSLEFLLYKTIQRDFRDWKDVEVVVPEMWYYIQEVFGTRIRFHHGHVFKFNGGIGGIAVPVQRKISQLNQIEHANLDVCGHFHSTQTFNNCIMNGSLVGANGYSMHLGIPFEPPKQTFFLMDSKYGRSIVTPIFIDREVKKDKISII